jgi:VWFA-related protein
MFIGSRLGCFLILFLFCIAATSAQEDFPQARPANENIHLDVVVTARSGPPVAGLQRQDFTVLDNKTPRTMTSFKAVTGRDASIGAILVIDAVNIDYDRVAYARTEIDKFLRAEGGHLAYPIALAVLTDKGVQIVQNFSSDGNSLSASLNRDDIGLRSIGRTGGYYGDTERLQISLQALRQLVAGEVGLPGRKIMLWVSPGWPFLSGVNTDLGSKQQQQVFKDIVSLSTQLRQGRITLYSFDPLGASEALTRDSYYKDFLKGISKPSQVYLGDLGLQVLAIQSGGLAFNSTNDITGLLQKCLADLVPYYEISFDSSPAGHPDEYHQLEIKLARPGLTARTRQGYYAQPSPAN